MSTKTLAVGPKIKTKLPGPNARQILEGDDKHEKPGVSHLCHVLQANWTRRFEILFRD